MTDGPERARLRSYLSGAKFDATDAAGKNWRLCGQVLEETANALRKGATKVREGDGKNGGLSGVTADAVLAAFQASAESMQEKGTRLVTAGETLRDTALVMGNAQAAEAGMADLNQPAPYTPPTTPATRPRRRRSRPRATSARRPTRSARPTTPPGPSRRPRPRSGRRSSTPPSSAPSRR
jgi:hypothetical protein